MEIAHIAIQHEICIHPFSENWLLAAIKCAFLFNGTEEKSFFIQILRLAAVAASAPYLAPGEHSLAGYEERHHLVEKFYKEATDMMQEHTDDISNLETIQIAIFLSFCARRHPSIPLPDNRHWFHIAIARLQQLMMDTTVASMTAQLRRIWWTCYLYERLDAFNSSYDGTTPQRLLDSNTISPLTLNDFDLNTSLLCLSPDNTGRSHAEVDIASQDLRAASMYIQKIWLATQMDKMGSKHHQSELTHDDTLWSAYEVQLGFTAWQKKTGNYAATIDRQSRMCPSLTVHWVSLQLLYCRTVIAFVNAAFAVEDKLSPQAKVVLRMIGRDRITYLYSLILAEAGSLLHYGQAAFAHATDPNIWASLLTATDALKALERDNNDWKLQTQSEYITKATKPQANVVPAYRAHLVHWKCGPKPTSTELPKLFSFSESPRSDAGSITSNSKASTPTLSSTATDTATSDLMLSAPSMTCVVYSTMTDTVDPWTTINHLESFIFNSHLGAS